MALKRLGTAAWLWVWATGIYGVPATAPLAPASSDALGTPPAKAAFGALSEVLLPPYQSAALARDLPVSDLRFMPDGQGLMMVGRTALWQWQFKTRALRRLTLPQASSALQSPSAPGALAAGQGTGTGEAPATALGSDGMDLFAAGPQVLFRVARDSGRIYRYGIPGAKANAHAVGFSGQGDDFWLIHAGGIFHVDRYGHSVVPRYAPKSELKATDLLAFDAARRRLFLARQRHIYRFDFTLSPDVDAGGLAATSAPTLIFKAKNEFVGMQLLGDQLLAFTPFTVLRLSATGKILGVIPVANHRRLLAASFHDDAHVYIFDDRLMEIFRPEQREVEHYRLPLSEDEKPSGVTLAGNALALAVGGQPRVFMLGAREVSGKK